MSWVVCYFIPGTVPPVSCKNLRNWPYTSLPTLVYLCSGKIQFETISLSLIRSLLTHPCRPSFIRTAPISWCAGYISAHGVQPSRCTAAATATATRTTDQASWCIRNVYTTCTGHSFLIFIFVPSNANKPTKKASEGRRGVIDGGAGKCTCWSVGGGAFSAGF